MESKSQVELLHQISNIVSSNLSLEKMLNFVLEKECCSDPSGSRPAARSECDIAERE